MMDVAVEDDLDQLWQQFTLHGTVDEEDEPAETETAQDMLASVAAVCDTVPQATDIYISTKTIIAYLNHPIDLAQVFWQVPVLKYSTMACGVVKKQMKFNSLCRQELATIEDRLMAVQQQQLYVDQNIITHIDNPDGRVGFKDVRKVSVGISKKDIMSCRSKKKSAFYNCFVLILRLLIDGRYREFHVKVFNTGKLEIPGIQSDGVLEHIRRQVLDTLRPLVSPSLDYTSACCETVLINSNFSCGFYLDREALCNILKYKYNIQTIYDSCSYPGIQCKYPLPAASPGEKPRHISFMVFRTGSVLIVGKCNEDTLMDLYGFLKRLLRVEYPLICQKHLTEDEMLLQQSHVGKHKKQKLRRRYIYNKAEDATMAMDDDGSICTTRNGEMDDDDVSSIATDDFFQ